MHLISRRTHISFQYYDYVTHLFEFILCATCVCHYKCRNVYNLRKSSEKFNEWMTVYHTNVYKKRITHYWSTIIEKLLYSQTFWCFIKRNLQSELYIFKLYLYHIPFKSILLFLPANNCNAKQLKNIVKDHIYMTVV